MANEKRLIDANALLEKVQFRLPDKGRISEIIRECVEICRKDIENAPTVDAVEVVHGRWIPIGTYEVCSHCGFEINRGERLREFFLVGNQYCRWCGAKMDGGNEDG